MFRSVLLLFISCVLSSCGGLHNSSYGRLSKHDRGNIKYRGHYKVGTPYKIDNKKYFPKKYSSYQKVGIASWYGLPKSKTANGDIFNKQMLTAAHKTLPLPSIIEVCNLNNGRKLIVMVNDRGPFVRKRELDLSQKAAELLHSKDKGLAKVRIKYLPRETAQFLNLLGLKQKEGSVAKGPLPNKLCTVNCEIKRINIRRGIKNLEDFD